MIDRLENDLDQYQFKNDNSPIFSLTQKGRKLQALKQKIIADKLPHHNSVFSRYLQQLQRSIQQNSSDTEIRKRSLSKQKVKRNKRICKQLQLPFEMYIYSSCQSQQQGSQNNQSPFRVEGSSSNSSQQQRQSEQQRYQRQKRTNKKIQQKMQSNNRIFSFAKNNRRIHMDRNVLDGLNNDKTQECKMLERLLDGQKIKQMVEKYTKVYISEIDDGRGDNKNRQHFIEGKFQKLITQQLSDMLSLYYMNIQTQLFDQITTQYLQRVYLPIQQQRRQQMIYYRKQQLQIKSNQLATLQSIHKEMKNNMHIERLIKMKQFRKTKRQLEQQIQEQQQDQLLILGQNDIKNRVNINKGRSKQTKVIRESIPSLVLNQITYNNTKKSQQQKDKDNYSKPLTQRLQITQSKTDRSFNPPKSKPGRTYQYKNQNNLSIKSLHRSKQQQQLQHLNSRKSKDKERKESSRYGKQKQFLMEKKDNKQSQKNIQWQLQLRKKQATIIGHSQQLSFNQLLQKFKSNYNQQRQRQYKNNPQSISLVQLKKLQLDQEYKQNIQAVSEYEVQHLKTLLDRVDEQLIQLNQEYNNKYKSIQLNNRVSYLQQKKQKIKKKLKSKIKLFWKYAHNNVTQSVCG